MQPAKHSNWYRRIGQRRDSAQSVVWFPHAGGGVAPLIRLAKELPPHINLFAATLPGREARYHDPVPATLGELTTILVDELPHFEIAPVLVGHSFGGLLAYCIAQEYTASGLVVMAMSSPDRIGARASFLHFDDADFAEELDRRYGGLPASLRENEEAMRLFLPTLRHDLTLLESYRLGALPSMDIPLTALVGTEDTRVTAAEMQGWRACTQGKFSMQMLPGNHFFPLAHFSRVLRIAQALFE